MSAASISRIGIGTVQFGLDYGVTNQRGKVELDEARRVLETARDAGMRVLDTAATYGESEAILGALAEAARGFRIVTKTPPGTPPQALREVLAASRQKLKRPRLDAVLVHHGRELLAPGGARILESLREARANGEIEKIGVSVYEPAELAQLLDLFAPDLVQLPLNLLDQRFAASGLLARLKGIGSEIHARSLFLQGTLLANPEALPPALAHARFTFERVARFLTAHDLSPLAACLGFGLSLPEIDCLIVGVAGLNELSAIIAAVRDLPAQLPDMRGLAVTDPDIVDPSRWRLESR